MLCHLLNAQEDTAVQEQDSSYGQLAKSIMKLYKVIHKPQAALALGHGNVDNGSPLSSGKKSLEKGPMVPQLVSCFFRCFLAPTLTPPSADTDQLAGVTGSQQQSCQSGQKHSKGRVTAFVRGSDTLSWAPPVSQRAGN